MRRKSLFNFNTIKKKLLAGVFIPFSIITLLLLSSLVFTDKVSQKFQKFITGVLKEAFEFKEIEKDVIQIQQWLTDISATRAAPGYDDGFKEAEKYYKDALRRIEILLKKYKKINDHEKVNILKMFKKQLEDFYIMGIKMANAYIKYGPSEGNKIMDKFDPFAEALSETMKKLIKDSENRLNKDERKIILSIKKFELKIFIILVILGAFTIIFLLNFISSITTPLMRLNNILKNMEKGDFREKLHLKRNDEFGEMSESFNKFVDSIKSITSTLKDTSLELEKSSSLLSFSVETVSKATNEQVEQTQSVATSMEELTATIEDNAKMVFSANEKFEEMEKITKESSKTIEGTIKTVENISEKTSMLESVISELTHSIGNVSNILNVITEIADQTNLLALNAAIEAARAGEHGRGFAVVADEVRKLAERTSKSVKEINDILSQIHHKTEDLKDAMNIALEEVSKGKEQAEQSRMMLEKIISSAESAKEISESISTATEEQAATVKDVNQNISSINDGIEMIKKELSSIFETSEKVSKEAERLKKMIESFKTT